MDGDFMSVIDDIEFSERVQNIVNLSFTTTVLNRELLIEAVQERSQTFLFLEFGLAVTEAGGTPMGTRG